MTAALSPVVRSLVLDTNIVLDLFVFQDPATDTLRQALNQKIFHWIATPAMRDELARVLTYPKIARRLAQCTEGGTADSRRPDGHLIAMGTDAVSSVLAQFDAQATVVMVAPRAGITCRDPDDQKFIDLAVTHQALLLSKDNAVLCMRKRLLALDALAQVAINLIA